MSESRQARILVVDDDADARTALALVLRPAFAILEAPDGEKALTLIAQEKPWLILLDVSMPGMGGIEVLGRALGKDPSLLIIMLTSRDDVELAIQALTLGAKEYITKPFDADYIRAEVSRLSDLDAPKDHKPWRVAP